MTEKTYQRFSLAHRLEHIIALTSLHHSGDHRTPAKISVRRLGRCDDQHYGRH